MRGEFGAVISHSSIRHISFLIGAPRRPASVPSYEKCGGSLMRREIGAVISHSLIRHISFLIEGARPAGERSPI